MIAIDTIDKVFVHEALPVCAQTEKNRFGYVLLFGFRPDDSLGLDDPLHEPSIARDCLVERIVIVLKVSLFHAPLVVGLTSNRPNSLTQYASACSVAHIIVGDRRYYSFKESGRL